MSGESSEAVRALEEMSNQVVNNRANADIVPPGERPCPICGKKMHIEVQYGIHLDVCSLHGVWLDLGELPAILSNVRTGNRINRQSAIRRARREGKMSGALFGAWSLLFD